MRQPALCLGRIGAVCVYFVGAVAVSGDDDIEVAPKVIVPNFSTDDSVIERQIFHDLGTATPSVAGGRARIESQLKHLLGELVHTCDLDQAQQQKLQLAARVDIKRFFEQIEGARKKLLILKGQKRIDLWDNLRESNAFYLEQIVPLQEQYRKGLFGEGSMFRKTLRNTLTADQQAKYQAALIAPRKEAYKVMLESSLHKVVVGLRVDQLVKLQELLLEQTKPPLQFGPYDQNVVLLNLGQIPAQELKEVLDKDQWIKLQPRLLQASGTEDWLAVSGIVEAVSPKPVVVLRSVRTVIETPAEAKQD